MNNCQYCHTDSDGYIAFLPRTGVGNAVLRIPTSSMPFINVSGPNRTRLQIPVEFCPKCGRNLIDKKDGEIVVHKQIIIARKTSGGE